MSRVTDSLMDGLAFSNGANQPMLDLTVGGQMGYVPVPAEWVSNAAYVRRNLIPILLEAPKFFQLMPDPQKWVECLRAIVERHCRTWEGFNAGLTVEFDEHPVGGAGEMQQEITDVKRARTEPSMTIVERYGMPVTTMIYHWICYGMMDPDVKLALSNTLAGERPDDMLPDWFTMSMAFIEPDPQHRRAVKTWVVVNMMPKGTGEITGRRDITAALEVTNLTIEWTGIATFNLGSNLFGQALLDRINMTSANPYLRESFIQEVDADVDAVATGYQHNVETLGESAVADF